MAFRANELFHGRYRLIEERGRGSFGEVWLAKDEELDLDVAVKIYIALDDRGVEEFKTEYKTVFEMRHPNILRADHYDICDNHPYLVMPFCPESASSLIGVVDEATMWIFIRDVARGMGYLHNRDTVHRDIKPDNILRDKEGTFVITDFGISKRMRSTLRRNSARGRNNIDVSGTIGYMAPELFSPNPEPVMATDIWSLGVTLYEILNGELPFLGQGGIMQLHGAGIPNIGDEFSQELNELVGACLSLNTWERPMANELAQFATGHILGKEVEKTWLSRREGGVDAEVVAKDDAKGLSCSGVSKSKEVRESGIKEKRKGGYVWIYALLLLLLIFGGGMILYYVVINDNSEELDSLLAVSPVSEDIDVTMNASGDENVDNGKVLSASGEATEEIEGAANDETDSFAQTPIVDAEEAVGVEVDNTEYSSQSQGGVVEETNSATKSSVKETSKSKESQKDKENAATLKSALAKNDYKTVQKLANEGYAPAYGPLAIYYLQNYDYKTAEEYAKKAKAAGYSEGDDVINALKGFGYYD